MTAVYADLCVVNRTARVMANMCVLIGERVTAMVFEEDSIAIRSRSAGIASNVGR